MSVLAGAKAERCRTSVVSHSAPLSPFFLYEIISFLLFFARRKRVPSRRIPHLCRLATGKCRQFILGLFSAFPLVVLWPFSGASRCFVPVQDVSMILERPSSVTGPLLSDCRDAREGRKHRAEPKRDARGRRILCLSRRKYGLSLHNVILDAPRHDVSSWAVSAERSRRSPELTRRDAQGQRNANSMALIGHL